jgi:peptidoglycan/LPS O-acetylase OafA/YrhL
MILVSAPVAWFCLLPPDMVFFAHSAVTVLGFFSNVFFSHTTGYFGVTSTLNPLIHTWSLAVEEQYYILFPILLTLLWPLGPRLIRPIFGVAAAVSLIAAQHFAKANPQFNFYLLPTRGWEILAGCLVAYSPQRAPANRYMNQLLSILGLALIAYSMLTFDDGTPAPSLWTLIPVGGAALVIRFADATTLVGQLLGLRPLVFIGTISYSLYLVHQPLLAFARLGLLAEPDLTTTLLLLLASFVLAYASWRFIERPFRNRAAVPRPRLLAIIGTAVVCVLGVSISGLATAGLPGRFGKSEALNQALVKDARTERARLVRGDVCQFNNTTNAGVDAFLEQWNCKDDGAFPQARRIPVIITGDSHSADKVIALKLNGLLPLQIGGAGCSIIPSRMSGDCARIFQRLHDTVATDPYYRYLVLAHAFTETELTPASIRETVAYWKTFNKQLIWFGGMPTFYQYSAHLERGEPARINSTVAAMTQSDEIKRILETSGIHIVDTTWIFCSINSCSYLSSEGCMLLTDDSHLSLWGARLFGRELLATDPFFAQWAREAGPSTVPDARSCHRPVGAAGVVLTASQGQP